MKDRDTTKTTSLRPFATLRNLNPQQSAGVLYSIYVLLAVMVAFGFSAILAMAKVTEAQMEEDWCLYISFLIPQVLSLVMLLTAFIGMKIPVKETVGKPSIKYFILAIVMQFGLLSLGELNTLFIGFLQKFGYEPNPVNIPSTQGFGLVGVLIVVAVLPAIFEELFFRGLLIRGLKDFGVVAGMLVCGVLFSIYHQNPVQTAYQFCCGTAFALIAIRAGSVFPTMLTHFINNAAIVLYYHFTGNDSYRLHWSIIVVSALCLVGTFVYLLCFDKKKKKQEEPAQKPKADVKGFILCVLIGVVVCMAMWTGALFA